MPTIQIWHNKHTLAAAAAVRGFVELMQYTEYSRFNRAPVGTIGRERVPHQERELT